MKWLPARPCISTNFHAFANDISDLVWLVLCGEQTEFAPVLLAAQQTQAVDVYKAEERGCLYTAVHTASRIYGISRAGYKVKQISDVMYVQCTYFMSGRSLIRDDSVTIRQERPSITEHQQIRRGPFTSKHADCEEYEVVL